MDFFGGSGTTGHAVAEAPSHRPACGESSSWSKRLTTSTPRCCREASVCCHHLEEAASLLRFEWCGPVLQSLLPEQYEEAISRAVYADEEGDLFVNTKTNPYSQYVFFADLKMAEALELDYDKDEVNVHLDRLYPDIDLAETLSCVTGKWIKRITADEVEFTDGSKQSLSKPDWRLLKPLIFWGPIV